ncbi:hypothetical protein HUA76_04070 [Myxococcus sp. CA056]|uniref:AMIN-like domain-containing (lipo)protein n=1 Tax=Myxococcus sp. CA056 TaxID=2741740 RepID=UPI00157AB95E|nr:hypothetical protein [Myxococcus sp. CA056]NTX09956.1 hypothetical protein [Myxococcus sp. CA056]
MKRAGRWLSSLWLAGCLVATGCSKKEEAPPHPAAELPPPDDTPALPSSPPEGTLPREGEAAAKPPVHVVTTGSTGVPVRGGAQDEELPVPSGEPTEPTEPPGKEAPGKTPPSGGGYTPEDPKNREWTSGVVDMKRQDAPQATLRSVRAGAHPDFDRVVFEFEGTQLPGYRVGYAKEPVVQCGSGDPASLAGKGQLQVTFTPARAHTDAGQPTVATRELKPALPVLLELERTCDFEGEVTWVLGNKSVQAFRVLELREPTRLVVDVQH